MPPGEQVVEDYRHLHLSLKAHPVSFLRADLDRRGITRHEHLPGIASGETVTVAGLVLVRQRPGTAKGVIFMTLEDETGIANTIVWPRTFEAFRPVVLGARLAAVTGRLQSASGVIHVVAEQIDDLTPLLRAAVGRAQLARCADRRGAPRVSRAAPSSACGGRAGDGTEGSRPVRARRADRQGDAEGAEFSLKGWAGWPSAVAPRLVSNSAGKSYIKTANAPPELAPTTRRFYAITLAGG